MSEAGRQWVGRVLFVAKGKPTPSLKVWWHPPAQLLPAAKPTPGSYHRKRLFLWIPRRMWHFDIHCPRCGPRQSLTSKGLYNRLRMVLDVKDYFYLACEYLECRSCSGTFLSWDHRLLDQLSAGVQAHFTTTLPHKYACEEAVVALLRDRTLGNSPSAHLLLCWTCKAKIGLSYR